MQLIVQSRLPFTLRNLLMLRSLCFVSVALPEWRVLDFADPQESWANEHQRTGEDVAGNHINNCSSCSGLLDGQSLVVSTAA